MTDNTIRSNTWKKILKGATALGGIGGILAIVALIYTFVNDRFDDASSKEQLNNQGTQIALQSLQLTQQEKENELNSVLNGLIGEQATVSAKQATLEINRLSPALVNDGNYSITATAIANQSIAYEATMTSIAEQQRIVEATQTALALPTPTTTIFIRADDVLPGIKGKDGELSSTLTWWEEYDSGNTSGILDPSGQVQGKYCYGLVWNTIDYGYHRLVVFQTPTRFTFDEGGWYTKVCIPNNVAISPEETGRIQANWLEKRYGVDDHPWQVIIR